MPNASVSCRQGTARGDLAPASKRARAVGVVIMQTMRTTWELLVATFRACDEFILPCANEALDAHPSCKIWKCQGA
eukprot:1553853-Pleurochrysis_carterae.AAC.2